ncbi:ISKra4 family transposase, partial [Streptomyces scabiei]
IESAYFADNAERMRYKTYLQRGYQIVSGVVEATCKHVVHQRLDQAGMHWRAATAEAIVALRANQLSTCPTDLRPHLAM